MTSIILRNKTFWIILTIVLVLIVGVFWYNKRKTAKENERLQDFHKTKYNSEFNGENVPEDFNPQPIADALFQAMNGAGTTETRFYSVLEPLNKDQLTVVHNAFNATYGKPPCRSLLDRLNPAADCGGVNGIYLRQWIEGDFDGDELSKALSFFSHIPEFNRTKI